MSTRSLLAAVVFMTIGAAAPAFGQAQPGQPGGGAQPGQPGGGAQPGGAGGPGGGRFDPQQFRERYNQRLKELMGATDEEWNALQPKIEKIQQLQRDAATGGRGFGMLFGGGRGGPGGGGPGGGGPGGGAGGPGGADRQPSVVQQKMTDLQTSLDNKEAKPDEIKAKMTAVREARAKAKADVGKAQDDLKELLTSRQEAVMVMIGVLD